MIAAVLVPCYQNVRTVGDVVTRAKVHAPVWVVDDGSNDGSSDAARAAGAEVLRAERNRGKGAALWSGLCALRERGFSHVISVDADGQLFPEDLPSFLNASARDEQALLIGQRDMASLPERNRYGNAVSNYWVNLAAETALADTQCGFRSYPTSLVQWFRPRANGFAFETQVIVEWARAGGRLIGLPVHVVYDQQHRVTHFRPGMDSTLITFLVMSYLFIPRALR